MEVGIALQNKQKFVLTD